MSPVRRSFRQNVKLALQARKTAEAAPEAWGAGQHFGKTYLDGYLEVLGDAGLLTKASPRMPSPPEIDEMREEANDLLAAAGHSRLRWTDVEKQAFEWGFMSALE